MINKKNLWFLTLFSLILVLSVYYVTMPNELLLTNGISYNEEDNDVVIKTNDSEILTALRVEANSELEEELDSLKLILNSKEATTDEKSDAFDKMKDLNINKTKETDIEKLLEESLSIKSFVKIRGNQIKVVVDKTEHDTTLANKIMRKIQEQFDSKKYITVEFKGK